MPRAADFTKDVKIRLAQLAGYTCSNPSCRVPTEGPQLGDSERGMSVGEAAHLHGAQPGAARYDENQTDHERKSLANGIWLCVRCHTIVDADKCGYPPSLLRQWKEEHEVWAHQRLSDPQSDPRASRWLAFAEVDRKRLERVAARTRWSGASLEDQQPVEAQFEGPFSVKLTAYQRRMSASAFAADVLLKAVNLDAETEMRIVGLWLDDEKRDFALSRRGQSYFVSEHLSTVKIPALDESTFRMQVGNLSRDNQRVRVEVEIGGRSMSYESALPSNLELCERNRDLRLRPLRQWFCDTCNLPILCPEDGWVEYREEEDAEGRRWIGDFRIVHKGWASPLPSPQICERDGVCCEELSRVSANPLLWGLAVTAYGDLASIGDHPERIRDLREWVHLMRRLCHPYYEQGRLFLKQAVDDSVVSEDRLWDRDDAMEWVVDAYVPEAFAEAVE